MGRIYLIRLENNERYRNIGVITNNKKDLLFSIGSRTKIFSKTNIYEIIKDIKIKELDEYLLQSIFSKKKADSICEAHSLRYRCYLKIDNFIWNLGYIDDNELIEYEEVFF